MPEDASPELVASVEDLVALWPGELVFEAVDARRRCLRLERVAGMSGVRLVSDSSGVVLRGADDAALSLGLYAMARDYLGARWYWPEAMRARRVGLPRGRFPLKEFWPEPAFEQRTLYPVGGAYTRRNGLNKRFSFNHNLARIFDVATFEEHPEVFASIAGERRRPKGSAQYDPQPDLTHPRAVSLAAEAARQHFRVTRKRVVIRSRRMITRSLMRGLARKRWSPLSSIFVDCRITQTWFSGSRMRWRRKCLMILPCCRLPLVRIGISALWPTVGQSSRRLSRCILG